ncbi:MAG TPA: hypothetical protein VH349_03105 [Ktedonobacterales bacterium]
MEPTNPSGDQAPEQPGATPSGATPSGEQPTMPSYPPVYPPAQPGQPTDPSQPLYGQPGAYPPPGQPGPYSQPLYGQPGQPGPYSQPLPGQPGPYSQPLYGQPGPYSQPLQAPPAQPKRSLRWLWITLAIVLVVGLLLGGGGFFAFTNYTAPATAAGKYCGYLKAQNYDSAYGMLSSKLKEQYTSDQFRQASAALDHAEGNVTACGAGTGSNAYKYTLFGNTATVQAKITRAQLGDLEGPLDLVNQDGWKVNSLSAALLGIDLGALDTLGKFCAALQSQNYAGAYALLGGTATTNITAEDFATAGGLHDQIDGTVSACALEQVNASGASTATPVQVSLTRAKLGKRVGAMTLAAESDATWKIQTIDEALLGTDTGPLQVGTRFCNDVFTGKSDDAATLITPELAAELVPLGGLKGEFAVPATLKFVSCTPDVTTYKVVSDQATYDSDVKVQVVSSGSVVSLKLTLYFVTSADGSWKVDGFK